MPLRKRKAKEKAGKKPDKYDITVAIDGTFEDAIRKIATDANEKMKRKIGAAS